MQDNSKRDEDTKARLIEAAGEMFAQQGYRATTVREICNRAGTHVGSVNYHFRDKRGLYAAILAYSHQLAVKKYPPNLGLGQEAAPEEKLRAFVLSFLSRAMDKGLPAWHGKLMTQEVVDPSNAFDQIVENSIRPLYIYLASIVRELMNKEKPSDGEESHETFLAAMSIVGQCLLHHIGRHVIPALRPQSFDPTHIEKIADHITRFSLGGIREVAAGGGIK
jgi:AcrR family transcriptional regulator